MHRNVHLLAGLLAPLCVAAFLVSTVLVELFGTPAAIARLKSLIVAPGLWILIPAVAAAGASGMFLGRSRRGRLVDAKRRRMPWIGANGVLVLLPCAIALDRWAAAGDFGTAFVVVQAVELIAGSANLALMALNVRDGLRTAGRLRSASPSPTRAG